MKLTDRQILKLINVYCSYEEIEGPIYQWVHSQLSKYKDGCKNPHLDWRENAIKAYKEFQEMGKS